MEIKPEKKIRSAKQKAILTPSFNISFLFLRIYPPNKNKEICVEIKEGSILIVSENNLESLIIK